MTLRAMKSNTYSIMITIKTSATASLFGPDRTGSRKSCLLTVGLVFLWSFPVLQNVSTYIRIA